jgi:hypothetical protein
MFAVEAIYVGRKGLDTDGGEHEGHISYKLGLSNASKAFSDASNCSDAEVLMLAEQSFLKQELQFCDKADTSTNSSIQQAFDSIEDALRSLKIAAIPASYKIAEHTYSHHPKFRVHKMPKDAFHNACLSHKTRLTNMLRVPGINMAEKALSAQRLANMSIAQSAYLKIQKAALGA